MAACTEARDRYATASGTTGGCQLFSDPSSKHSADPHRPSYASGDRTAERVEKGTDPSGGSAGTDLMTDLVGRAQRGDRSAFDELYERNVGRVYAICLRLTADGRLAEELTQDVFVRAWRKIGSFRGGSRFSTWLYRLAANLVLDALRRRGRERGRTADLGAADLVATLGAESESRLDLERALAGLPERARTALVLHAIEGYRYREVADLMGIALGTVKAHISQARKLLLEEVDG